jgi:hypothetical protein
MINTVNEFMDVLCSPITVMCTPPVHYHLDFLDLDVEIHHSFELVVKNASEFSLGSLEEAIGKYPPEKFPQSRAREAYELRERLLSVLGLEESGE